MKHLLISLLSLAAMATAALAEGDAAKGQKAFKKCQACHTADDATNKVGPSLKGVVGRTPGTVEGYKYSEAMVQYGAAGNVWNDENLEAYMADPKGTIPGNKMTLAGIKKEDEREDIIAFLKTKM